jgi:1-deoxy-D-xylulose-5-phosphate reductoisomerase
VALNAADEVAVAAFLDGKIAFDDIARIIEGVITETPARRPESINEVLAIDSAARQTAQEMVQRRSRRALAR